MITLFVCVFDKPANLTDGLDLNGTQFKPAILLGNGGLPPPGIGQIVFLDGADQVQEAIFYHGVVASQIGGSGLPGKVTGFDGVRNGGSRGFGEVFRPLELGPGGGDIL